MKRTDINIRDPYVLYESGKYYMYGTRANNFGVTTSGFDVYVSEDLEEWSEPLQCFCSDNHNMNHGANWAPEVHKYKGSYYMLATFTGEFSKLRGTYVLKADNPMGPFVPHSDGAVTPPEWECLDGTLYISKDGKPYLVFCHEHTQIIDGTMCYIALSDDLSESVGEAVTMFSASMPEWADKKPAGEHYVTDGPFMHRTDDGELYMFWSTFIKKRYAVCIVKFQGGELCTDFCHLTPLLDDDGGHGMIFSDGVAAYLTFHSPNKRYEERPCFRKLQYYNGRFELI